VLPGEGELATRLEKNGVKTQVIPLPSIRPWYALNILSILGAYLNVCRRYRPALIYANGPRAALYGGIVGRILKIPVIWHCRIADTDIYLDFLLHRLSHCIIANSRATANRFRDRSPSKVKVIYNGIDIGWLRDNSVRKPAIVSQAWKVILVVARVSRWKRHDLILEAFERVASLDSSLHLVCLGSRDTLDPTWWRHLQERSRRSVYLNRIHWVGHVQDVRPWYNAAYVLVLASDNEPFGRVLVEAMACGLSVVATRSGGIPEIVRHYQDGILVTPGNVDEFASAISEISNNDPLRERLSRSAKKRAEDFSLELHVARMISVFEDTIKDSNSHFHVFFK